MSAVRICSWNVNSVRARLPLVERLVAERAPDILCLQEIKVETQAFPHAALQALGFAHRAVFGQRGHHGVAILSRIPLEEIDTIDWCAKGDARHVSVRLPGGVRLHDFYVPAGGDVPDPVANPRFAHKLAFLDEMIAWARKLEEPSIALGDFNVAPLACDVWNHRALLDVVSHTPAETERLERLRDAHDWFDAVRAVFAPPRPVFTWWSYRARDWRASNRGRRLDHVWLSPTLAPALKGVEILEDARGWERPSDHVPVIVDLDL